MKNSLITFLQAVSVVLGALFLNLLVLISFFFSHHNLAIFLFYPLLESGRTDSAIKNFCNSNMKKKLLAANPKYKQINDVPSYNHIQKSFRNQNLNFDLIIGQNRNSDNVIMEFKPNEMKGVDLITGTTSQPNNWIFPFHLQMGSDQDHFVPALSSLATHGEEIETDLDVDLPPLPPSFKSDLRSVLDHHPPENFDLLLCQNWDPNHMIMQFEPSEMNIMD